VRKEKAIANRELPAEEWNFQDLEQEEVLLAFYYEYARDCPAVIKEVEKMRAARPKPNIWPYCPREHHLFAVIEWLAHQDRFPKTPFLRLRKEGRAQFLEQANEHIRTAKEMNRNMPPGYSEQHVDPVTPERSLESVKPGEWMCLMFPGSETNIRPRINFKHTWLGDASAMEATIKEKPAAFDPPQADIAQKKSAWEPVFKAQPEGSIFEFGINWRLTDAEILDTVSRIIKGARPKQFAAHANKAAVQRGFNGTPLPFRMSNALDWLGVLRRRKCVSTWKIFFEFYEEAQFKTENPEWKFIHTDARPRQEDCSKAEIILDWVEKGTPLDARAFV
jgi:hypothetical protein